MNASAQLTGCAYTKAGSVTVFRSVAAAKTRKIVVRTVLVSMSVGTVDTDAHRSL